MIGLSTQRDITNISMNHETQYSQINLHFSFAVILMLYIPRKYERRVAVSRDRCIIDGDKAINILKQNYNECVKKFVQINFAGNLFLIPFIDNRTNILYTNILYITHSSGNFWRIKIKIQHTKLNINSRISKNKNKNPKFGRNRCNT